EPASDAFSADEWFKDPADGYGATAAVNRVRHAESEHPVDGPRVQSPVQEGLGHTHLGEFVRAAFPPGFRVDGRIREGFTDTVEDQADAHPGGKQHREPGASRKFGFILRGAELDAPVFG